MEQKGPTIIFKSSFFVEKDKRYLNYVNFVNDAASGDMLGKVNNCNRCVLIKIPAHVHTQHVECVDGP